MLFLIKEPSLIPRSPSVEERERERESVCRQESKRGKASGRCRCLVNAVTNPNQRDGVREREREVASGDRRIKRSRAASFDENGFSFQSLGSLDPSPAAPPFSLTHSLSLSLLLCPVVCPPDKTGAANKGRNTTAQAVKVVLWKMRFRLTPLLLL